MKLTIKAFQVLIAVLAIIYIPLAVSLWQFDPAFWPASARVAGVVLFMFAVGVIMIIGAIKLLSKAEDARKKSYDEYVAQKRRESPGGFSKMLQKQLDAAEASRQQANETPLTERTAQTIMDRLK